MKTETASFITPEITVLVKEGEKHLWSMFHPHHYMTAYKPLKDSLPKSATFYTFYWLRDGIETLVGCLGVIFQISKKAPSKRLTRVVVLPEFQGMGFGSMMVNNISEYYHQKGFRMYAATFHPRLGEYREASPLWEGSHYNKRAFKTNEDAKDIGATGLRDGEDMYRHMYVPNNPIDLIFDPIALLALERKIKVHERDKKRNEAEYFRDLKDINKIYDIMDRAEVKAKVFDDMTPEQHQEAKDEHQKMFKKDKRKALSPAERKALKEQKRKEKNEK